MADPTLVEQTTPYIASGVVAIAALLLGRWLERRDSHAAWLRERQLAAYAELLVLAHEAWTGTSRLFSAAWDDPRREEYIQDMNASNLQMGRGVSMIEMLGPNDVHEAAKYLDSALDGMFAIVLDEKLHAEAKAHGRPLTTEAGQHLLDAERKFVEAAHRRIR